MAGKRVRRKINYRNDTINEKLLKNLVRRAAIIVTATINEIKAIMNFIFPASVKLSRGEEDDRAYLLRSTAWKRLFKIRFV